MQFCYNTITAGWLLTGQQKEIFLSRPVKLIPNSHHFRIWYIFRFQRFMKQLVLFCLVVISVCVMGQGNIDYMFKMAADVGIKRPIPAKYALKSVRVPIKTDSLSMVHFHAKYYKTMEAGTIMLSAGSLLTIAHILVAEFVPHYSFNGVVALATIGVATATAGSITLPLGASKRHRYKRSIKIALAKEGL